MYAKINNYIYNYKKCIGKGTFSTVHKGINLNNNQKIAVKIIDTDKLNQKIQDFINVEIDLMKKMNHPNIVKFYDALYNSSNKKLYIILEYCENGDMSRILNKSIKLEYIYKYLCQIRDGFKYLYENKIMHRDIKPMNILITDNGSTIKIADFGYARNVLDDILLMNTICGSPYYASPDILINRKYNIKSDLWSIGVLIYELVYNKTPYHYTTDLLDLIDKLKTNEIEYPFRCDIPDELYDLMKNLLIKNEKLRISWEDFFDHPFFKLNIDPVPNNIKNNNDNHDNNNNNNNDNNDDNDDNDNYDNKIGLNNILNHSKSQPIPIKFNNKLIKYTRPLMNYNLTLSDEDDDLYDSDDDNILDKNDKNNKNNKNNKNDKNKKFSQIKVIKSESYDKMIIMDNFISPSNLELNLYDSVDDDILRRKGFNIVSSPDDINLMALRKNSDAFSDIFSIPTSSSYKDSIISYLSTSFNMFKSSKDLIANLFKN